MNKDKEGTERTHFVAVLLNIIINANFRHALRILTDGKKQIL